MPYQFAIAQENQLEDENSVEEIRVEGRKTPDSTIGQPTIELGGTELMVKVSGTLGETISAEPGVHNASFGPAVGLPVLRGLSGVRVRLVQDQIGAWDGSSLSGDHATTLEAASANTIRVVRGPTTLVHGGAAIGGVVEVETQRIPFTASSEKNNSSLSRYQTDSDDVFFQAETRRELVNDHDQTTNRIRLDAHAGKIGIHFDGFLREHDDVQISGQAIDTEAVAQQFGDIVNFNFNDTLPNTASDARNGAVGFAWNGEVISAGVSVSRLDNRYGIPIGAHIEVEDAPGGGHHHAHPSGNETDGGIVATPVRVDLNHKRHDGRVKWHSPFQFANNAFLPSIDEIEILVSEVNYDHIEEEVGVISTEFINEVLESRLKVLWSDFLGFEGELGWQGFEREFSARGVESFVPATDQEMDAFYWVGQKDIHDWQIELGSRYEITTLSPNEPTAPYLGVSFQFSPIEYETFSHQMAFRYQWDSDTVLSTAFSLSQRAPDVHELLSFGQHLATRSFDMGALLRNGPLDAETFSHAEVGLESALNFIGYDIGDIKGNLFYTDAKDYIYQQNTGLLFDRESELFQGGCSVISECLTLLEYTQEDATFWGYELNWELPSLVVGKGEFIWSFFSDYVRGKFNEVPTVDAVFFGENSARDIPRLPPMRIGSEFQYQKGEWQASLRMTQIRAQKHTGLNELPTDQYLRADMSVVHQGYLSTSSQSSGSYSIFLRGKNLLDKPIRNSTSFLRHYAPETGRSVELGVRFEY
ncbi:TonB-dependent receptor [Marinibactrum halimedae]|uniref:TonB-dependent receptor n=2 Tax=Marinibactrum halimedae TaxID=1444977 RepID=A0AA37T3V7_9GAMM|nr:TonB-dependent receptor [Marinibactrum halimedae]